ncbi:MAG: sulfite exporter TauE/SafE family protein [Bacteroidota bacterium]
MDTWVFVVAVGGGFFAGVINTLAGNGSAITLTILTELLGLPPNVANGTNRIGVLLQSVSSGVGFIQSGRIDLQRSRWPLLAAVVGAIAGVWLAVSVSHDQFKSVFQYMLIVMLGVVLINPKRWLRKHTDPGPLNLWIAIPSFFALGFYGGFIQMGMGVFFLVVCVVILKYNIIDANALKTVVIAMYSLLVVGIFHYHDLIDWRCGLIVASGQAVGGYLTATFASRFQGIEIWAYRLLVLVIGLAILRAFGVFG